MERKVSEFLVEKWRNAFRFYDYKNHGELTVEDLASIADFISQETKANPEEAAITRQEFVKWHSLLQPDPTKKLDMEAVVNGAYGLFQDHSKFVELERAMASDFFDRMDRNKDGKVDYDELKVFYRAFGIRDEKITKEIFTCVDTNGDGFVDREEVVDDYVRYFTDPDPITGKAFLIPHIQDKVDKGLIQEQK